MNNAEIAMPMPYNLVLSGKIAKPEQNTAVLSYPSQYSLREYQKYLIDKIFASWESGNRRILLQLATGGGKTILFTDIVKTFLSQNLKALIIAHKKELISQAHGKIKQITSIDAGYIKAGFKPDETAPVQVASIQTLSRRNKPPSDLLVIDEAHHSAAKSYSDLFDIYSDAKILGVTATPIRIDGQGFQHLYDDLIVGPNTDWLIEMGYLSRFRLFAAPVKLEVKENKKKNREYSQAALSKAIRENAIVNEKAIDTWFKYAENKQTVVFAVSVEHSLKLRDLYRERGIIAEHLDGNTPDIERERIINDFRDKKITVLTNCEIISEGFDVPSIECVQCIRPTQSIALWLQMIGRALRPSDGKEFAIILDHTYNYTVLGLPDVNREWSLEPIAIEADKYSLECDGCGHIFRPLSDESTRIIRVGYDSKGKFRKHYQANCPVCQETVEFDRGTGGEPIKRKDTAIEELEIVEIENKIYEWFIDYVEQLLAVAKSNNYKKAWIQHQILDQESRQKYYPDIPLINLKLLRLKEWQFLAKVLGYKKGWAWHRHADTQNIIKLKESQII